MLNAECFLAKIQKGFETFFLSFKLKRNINELLSTLICQLLSFLNQRSFNFPC